jgi:hypothetical protein
MDRVVALYENVIWFHITVSDANIMEVLESAEKLPRHDFDGGLV